MDYKYEKKKFKVSIIGLGYIGLPTAVLIANAGHIVNGFDVSTELLKMVKKGECPFDEPDLQTYLTKALESGNLNVSDVLQPGDLYIICVPTPLILEGISMEPDLSYVFSALDEIIPILKNNDSIIIESTIPVGTTHNLHQKLCNSSINIDNIYLAYCPERVIPGKIIPELLGNDRIIGGINEASSKFIAEFYRSFISGEVIETESKVAEFCKLSENSFRDVNIAFANELSLLCDKEGIDVLEVISNANRHPRVNILIPGAGVGGHCIAIDPWFLVSRDEQNAQLIKKAREVNDHKPKWVANKILTQIQRFKIEHGHAPKVICCGLSYKPDSDDLRESPSIKIALELLNSGVDLEICEPNISAYKNFKISSLENTLDTADIVCLLVKHSQFTDHNFLQSIKDKQVLDFCGATFEGRINGN